MRVVTSTFRSNSSQGSTFKIRRKREISNFYIIARQTLAPSICPQVTRSHREPPSTSSSTSSPSLESLDGKRGVVLQFSVQIILHHSPIMMTSLLPYLYLMLLSFVLHIVYTQPHPQHMHSPIRSIHSLIRSHLLTQCLMHSLVRQYIRLG